MLALSTFRRSDAAVRLAIDRAREGGKLFVLYVADVNLARYMVGSDLGFFSDLEEKCEEEVLSEHEERGREEVAAIAERARQEGLEVAFHVRIGRFAEVALDLLPQVQPGLVVTTRSPRPHWVRRFFGSPVDRLVEEAGCPVEEA
jgi:nucleotide-binding universal stress UspA family protein